MARCGDGTSRVVEKRQRLRDRRLAARRTFGRRRFSRCMRFSARSIRCDRRFGKVTITNDVFYVSQKLSRKLKISRTLAIEALAVRKELSPTQIVARARP